MGNYYGVCFSGFSDKKKVNYIKQEEWIQLIHSHNTKSEYTPKCRF